MGGNHNVHSLEAGVSYECLQELGTLIDVIHIILGIGDVDPPELDPSPTLGRDDPDVASRERLAELFLACEEGGKGDIACQAVDEIACDRNVFRPPTSEDQGRVSGRFVEGSLSRLDDVDGRSPCYVSMARSARRERSLVGG
jgi:hypothetical protein